MRPRKLVVAALVRDGSKILMSRRRADQPMPNLWEFPGGKVEPGEAPTDALAREVREELGCEVAVGRIHDVVFHAYPEFDLYMLVYGATFRVRLPADEGSVPAQVASPASAPTRGYPRRRVLAVDDEALLLKAYRRMVGDAHELTTALGGHEAMRLLERDQDWLRIRLANGLEGWVRTRDIGRL